MDIFLRFTDLLIFLGVIFVGFRVYHYKSKYNAAWSITATGFILFLISHLLGYFTSSYAKILEFSFGILASVTMTYGIWRYFYKTFLYQKKRIDYGDSVKRFVIFLEIVVIMSLPYFFLSKSNIAYQSLIENSFWILAGLLGLIFTITLKFKLPKIFILYFLHIKRTTNILIFTFPFMILWNVSELAHYFTKIDVFVYGIYIFKPLTIVGLILFLFYSLHPEKEKAKETTTEANELLRVQNVMIRDPITCNKNITLQDAANLMDKKKVGSLLVMDSGDVIGIITERDYVSAIAKKIPVSKKVDFLMTSKILSVDPNKLISDAIALMQNKNIKRLPVIHEGSLVGIITQTNLLNIMNNFAFEILHIAEKHKMVDLVDDDNKYSINIGTVMNKDVITAKPQDIIVDVLKIMAEKKIGSVVVVDGEDIKGIFTEHHLITMVISKGVDPEAATLGTLQLKIPKPLHPNMSIFKASEIMKKNGVKRVPVVEQGKLVGIVTQGKLLQTMNVIASKIVSLKVMKKKYLLLKPGVSYIVKEEKPNITFSVFEGRIAEGADGLLISRIITNQLQKDLKLGDTPVIWLTEQQSENSIKPTQLEKLSYTISRFLDSVEHAIVVIDGVEYLINYTSFKEVIHFITNITDSVALHNSNLLININPKAIDEKELSMLERTMETFKKQL